MLRLIKNVLVCLLILIGGFLLSQDCTGQEKMPAKPDVKAIRHWQNMRFGMFIHWGPVSLKGTEIGWSRGSQVPKDVYDQLYKRFNPVKFNAEQWVKIAADAGMKYLVITAKHHDGFCLWPSKYTNYNIAHTPFKRDILKELSQACKKYGVMFCVYYSVCDWHHPDYPLDSPGGRGKKPHPNMPRYFQYVKNQTKELIDNYGPLGVMWFDGEWEKPWTRQYGNELYNYLKKIQPSLIINNRVSKGRKGMSGTTRQTNLNAGDFDTPEQRIGGFNRQRPWETCMTICHQWAWKPHDKMKSLRQCIQTLINTVGGDGNLLLNVGPMPDGQIEPRQVKRLREIGQWLKKYGSGIYGTRGGPFKPGKWGASTCKDNHIYLYIMNWQINDKLLLPGISDKIIRYRTLSAKPAIVKSSDKAIEISLNKIDQDKITTVIELTVAGKAFDIKPIAVPDPTVAHLARPEVVKKWKDRRFGMFIHWGPVSLKGTEISWSRKGPRRGRKRGGTGFIPMAEYDNLYKKFNPVKFDANQWVQIAKDAGMKYIIFVTKHHDGFSMFDSKLTDYDIMNTPYPKDICRQLADACHKQGMSLGWYYSPRDWYNPYFATANHQKYLDFYLGQLRELCSNYGKIDVIWFDGLDSPREIWKDAPQRSFFLIHSLQPDIIINNRGGLRGDFDTPEQRIGAFQLDRPWETCMTICRQWSWKPHDKMKSLKRCIQTLVKVAGGDGNFLFNVGPMPDGRIEPRQVQRLKEMGNWLKAYGQSIYATRGGPFIPGVWGASTRKGNIIYLHILNSDKKVNTDNTADTTDIVELGPLSRKIITTRVLTGGEARVQQNKNSLRIILSSNAINDIDTIVKLTLDGSAMDIKPVANVSGAVSVDKKARASNVFQKMKIYGPDKALDDNAETRWATDASITSAWLEVDLGKAMVINQAVIDEHSWNRVKKFALQCRRNSDTLWKTVYRGTSIGNRKVLKFKPTQGRYFRLDILDSIGGPTIWEFQLFADSTKK